MTDNKIENLIVGKKRMNIVKRFKILPTNNIKYLYFITPVWWKLFYYF